MVTLRYPLSSLTLLVGWREEHAIRKKISRIRNLQRFSFRRPLGTDQRCSDLCGIIFGLNNNESNSSSSSSSTCSSSGKSTPPVSDCHVTSIDIKNEVQRSISTPYTHPLPDDLRDPSLSADNFRKGLKTHLFRNALGHSAHYY